MGPSGALGTLSQILPDGWISCSHFASSQPRAFGTVPLINVRDGRPMIRGGGGAPGWVSWDSTGPLGVVGLSSTDPPDGP